MKVKELIELLSKLDAEKEIGIDDYDDTIAIIKGVNTHVLLPSGEIIYGIQMMYEDDD